MTYQAALARLRAAFGGALPGLAAHGLLAPRPRGNWPQGFDPANIRHAAGLLLLFQAEDGGAHIVLTVRAHTLGRHGGQVSLPGGVVEAGESYEQAALREAHEEIALPLAGVSVVGALTPIDIPVSGFRLHPIVAASAARPALAPSDGEVARILDVPLDVLLEPSRFATAERTRDKEPQTIPMFRVGDDEIWGATAMVLSEFLVLLGWRRPARP